MTAQDLKLLREIGRRRTIQLRGRIKTSRARSIAEQIRRLGRRSKKPIRLNIHSRGGDYWAALVVCDAILESPVPVYGVASVAYSSALVILQVCQLRVGRAISSFIAKPARVPFPPFSVGPYTDEEHVAMMMKELITQALKPHVSDAWKRAHDILLTRVKKVGKTEQELHKLLAHGGTVLSAREALRWGFLDVVMYSS